MGSQQQPENPLYWLKKPMEYVKITAQMAVGLILLKMLGTRFIFGEAFGWEPSDLARAFDQHGVLAMVSRGLAYSAGIELAFMLFTPGPDEAIEPVIIGIAAAILMLVSGDISLRSGLAVAVLGAAMGGLFYLRGATTEKPKFFW
nr:hypothetical protein [uncultured Rhodopila sp.]